MVSTAFGLGEAANQRFFVLGPGAIRMGEALRRYCAVFHPDIKKVTSMPFWLVKLLATITGDQGIKGAGELVSYFEKVGEGNNDSNKDNGILDAPRMTLDGWLQKRKERIGTDPGATRFSSSSRNDQLK